MVRVVVDGSTLTDASADRGIGVYVQRVLAGLAHDSDIRLDVLARSAARVPAAATWLPLGPTGPQRTAAAVHAALLPLRTGRSRADVVFSPAQTPPWRSARPWVQTLHDLTPLVFPHPLLAGDARRWRRIGPRLRSAAAVITVSRSSAEQAQNLLGIPSERIHVVYHGVDGSYRPEGSVTERERPYLLYVSAWGPHKGAREAAAAVSLLADAGFPHELLVAGRQDPWMRSHLDVDLATAGRPDRIHVLGYVDDLASLYRGADAVIVTSRAEGFGMPALEAMACGAPVVAFANTSLPEVVGDGGLLVTDGNVAELVEAVRRVLSERGLAAELRERSVAQAKRFDWAASVDAHAEILKAAATTG